MKSLRMIPPVLLWAPVIALAAGPSGLWEGSLKTPAGDVSFVFNIHRDGDQWAAEMDVPDRLVSALPLSNVKVDGNAITLPIPGQGDPNYAGKLSDDGKTITGTFNQAGASIPMDLKWKSEPRAVAKAQPNSGDVQVLEGTWEGTLDANGTTLHVRFNFVKNADGSIAGTFDSLDQGATGLPISSINRTGDKVNLEMKSIGGTYEGALDKDASAMTGSLTQGGGTVALNLTRKKK